MKTETTPTGDQLHAKALESETTHYYEVTIEQADGTSYLAYAGRDQQNASVMFDLALQDQVDSQTGRVNSHRPTLTMDHEILRQGPECNQTLVLPPLKWIIDHLQNPEFMFRDRFQQIELEGPTVAAVLGTVFGLIAGLEMSGNRTRANVLACEFVRQMDRFNGRHLPVIDVPDLWRNGDPRTRKVAPRFTVLRADNTRLGFTWQHWHYLSPKEATAKAEAAGASVLSPDKFGARKMGLWGDLYAAGMFGGYVFHKFDELLTCDIRDLKNRIVGWASHS